MKHIYQNILILACTLAFLLAGKEAGAVPSPEVTPDYTVSFINASLTYEGGSMNEVYVSADGGSATIAMWWTNIPTEPVRLTNNIRNALSGTGITVAIPRYVTTSEPGMPSVAVKLTFPPLPDSLSQLSIRFSCVKGKVDILQVPRQSIKTSGRNWTESRTYYGEGASDYVSDIVYYNGLGLPDQRVSSAASGNGRSIVTPVTYDNCLRGNARVWLPYEVPASTGAYSSSATSPSKYSSLYGEEESQYTSTDTGFDSGYLDRPLWSRKPGKAHYDTDSRSATAYGVTTSEDKVLDITYDESSQSIEVSTYRSGLEKTVTTDEDGRRKAVYTDFEGKVILSRVFEKTSEGEYVPYADTYTVYDGAGRVRWVLSPEGSAQIRPIMMLADEGDVAKKWATVYRYDNLGRKVGRRLPGCGWEEYVYDRGDRLVLERDAVLSQDSRWIYRVYDNLGREIERTIVSDTTHAGRESLQSAYDTCNYPNTYPYPGHSCDSVADYRKPAPAIGTGFTLARQLYSARYGGDEYRISPSSLNVAKIPVSPALAFAEEPGVISSSDKSSNNTNRKIYERVWIDGDNTSGTSTRSYVERAFYYDERGRLIQTVETNQSGGKSRRSVRYDYCDRPLVVCERYGFPSSAESASAQCRTTTYTYDNRGRILSESVVVNDLPEAAVEYSYDAVGRLSEVIYGNGIRHRRSYTVQGWLDSLESVSGTGDTLFREKLRYWDNDEGEPLYSGMISGSDTYNGSETLAYTYGYDYIWRLTGAVLPGSDRMSEQGISYDRNGNIRSLKRYDSQAQVLDDVTLSYTGNRIAWYDRGNGEVPYAYDGCGRLTHDGRLCIDIEYGDSGRMLKTTDASYGPDPDETLYSYLADGERIGVAKKTGAVQTEYDGYLNWGSIGMRHAGAEVEFESSLFSGGVILPDGVKYFTKDHLGNVRMVTDGDGAVVERNDYYPFGRRCSGGASVMLPGNRWRYAGKEKWPMGYTGWLDFGSRQYDSYLGRWTTVDPLSEKYPGVSPYAYCADNPVMFVDEDGEDLVIFGANGSSVTFTTDLIDLSVNVGGLGIDWCGNYTLEGRETLSAALDIAGIFDPSGIADGANALLQMSEGSAGDALLSAISLIPGGDIVKIGKIGKDIRVIKNSLDAGAKTTLHRPYIRKWVRKAVEAKAEKLPDGRFIDPNTRKPINGKYDLGHKRNYEFWRMKAEAEAKGMTQKEFNDYMNNPDFYQIEDSYINRSHTYENKTKY